MTEIYIGALNPEDTHEHNLFTFPPTAQNTELNPLYVFPARFYIEGYIYTQYTEQKDAKWEAKNLSESVLVHLGWKHRDNAHRGMILIIYVFLPSRSLLFHVRLEHCVDSFFRRIMVNLYFRLNLLSAAARTSSKEQKMKYHEIGAIIPRPNNHQ